MFLYETKLTGVYYTMILITVPLFKGTTNNIYCHVTYLLTVIIYFTLSWEMLIVPFLQKKMHLQFYYKIQAIKLYSG